MTQTQNVCIHLYVKQISNSVYTWNAILSSSVGLICCLHHPCTRTYRGVCGTVTVDIFIHLKSRGSSGSSVGQGVIPTCGHSMFSQVMHLFIPIFSCVNTCQAQLVTHASSANQLLLTPGTTKWARLHKKGLNYETVEISCSLSAWHLNCQFQLHELSSLPYHCSSCSVSQKNPGTTWKNMDKSTGGFVSITSTIKSENTKNKGTDKWVH